MGNRKRHGSIWSLQALALCIWQHGTNVAWYKGKSMKFLNYMFSFRENFVSSVKVSSQNINVSQSGSQIKVEWLQVWLMHAGTASYYQQSSLESRNV